MKTNKCYYCGSSDIFEGYDGVSCYNKNCGGYYEDTPYTNHNDDEVNEDIIDGIILTMAQQAIIDAAKETMDIMGYNVIAENGWVIKIYANGKKERIKKIEK